MAAAADAIAVPQMLKYGYHPRTVYGVVVQASSLENMIIVSIAGAFAVNGERVRFYREIGYRLIALASEQTYRRVAYVIITLAAENRVPILDLRLICNERMDYANEIEPSGPDSPPMIASMPFSNCLAMAIWKRSSAVIR